MQSDPDWAAAELVATRDLSPTVREFVLCPADGVRPWTAGSHLRLQLELAGRAEVRSYSLTGLPADSQRDGCYRIAVKRADPGRGGSRRMWQLQAGHRLRLAGPDNRFELPRQAPFVLLVAGGIGITPVVGMALTLAARGQPLRLAYSARDEHELVFSDVLRATLGPQLQTFANAAGERLVLAEEIAALPPAAVMMVCGPVPLLQAAQQAWADAGRHASDLRFETFGSSGSRPAEAFWVQLPRHGLKLQVPADRSLLDVLADNGVDTLSDCLRGECGLCAVDVLEVQGALDHRDVFFSAQEKQSGRRMCACVSRVCGGGVVLDSDWRPDIP
jgi:vanillate O-demethylase ferredoxin subunit